MAKLVMRKLIHNSKKQADQSGQAQPRHLGAATKTVVGVASLAMAGGGFLVVAPSAFAASGAPTHGKTTCSIAGDECTNAITYANAHDGGGAVVLAVEADTETHGGTTLHKVFDIRIQTKNGIYVEHVYRNDAAPFSDGIWWQSMAENQASSPSSSTGATGGSGTSGSSVPPPNPTTSSADNSPDHSSSTANQGSTSQGSTSQGSEPAAPAHNTSPSTDANSTDTSGTSSGLTINSGSTSSSRSEAVQPPEQSSAASSSTNDSPKLSPSQAASDATSYLSGQGYSVLGTKSSNLTSKGQKDYFKVKVQLGKNGQKDGTVDVWVDATTSSGTVTAASGSGIHFRDTNLVTLATAQANAIAATGGGSVYKGNINGGKWRWYWIFVRNGSTKYKVGVDAATGVVTQSRKS